MYAEDFPVLDKVFPVEVEPKSIDDLTMGFSDFSEGKEATRLLREMSPEVREAVVSFACRGMNDTLSFAPHLYGLVSLLHREDPARRSAEAVDATLEEIERSRLVLEATMNQDALPALVWGGDPQLSDDSMQQFWLVRQTKLEKTNAEGLLGSFGIMTEHVVSPSRRTFKEFEVSILAVIGENIELNSPD